MSPEGIILYWNRGAEEMFGHEAHEAIGLSLSELIVLPERREEEHTALLQALETGFSTVESIRMCKDGSLVYVLVTNKAIRNSLGEVDYIISSKKDITQL